MKDKIETLWNILREVNNQTLFQSKSEKQIKLDPIEYRLDDLGAVIKKSEYGKQTEFGWTVDHIFPTSKGGDNNIRNLQLLHWKNNELKGDDFPNFAFDTAYNRESMAIENISIARPRFTFQASFIESLSDLYPTILQYKVSQLESIIY